MLSVFAETINSVPWQAHPDVWLLVVASFGAAWCAKHVIEPKAVLSGLPAITSRQKAWYFVGVASMWLASDWPLHDVADEYLYSAHMLQHLLISMIIPAMYMMAIPRWIFELIVPPGSTVWRFLAWAARPVPIFVIYNGFTGILHWSGVVQLMYDSGIAHFGFHAAAFAAGLLLWLPIVGPVEEWKLSPFAQCIFLFSMSIIPTVPGAWLVFAEGIVYPHYAEADRLFGIGALSDQQAAGAVMKILGGFFMWAVIAVIYGRFARDEQRKNQLDRVERDRQRLATLTFDEVSAAFDESPSTLIEP